MLEATGPVRGPRPAVPVDEQQRRVVPDERGVPDARRRPGDTRLRRHRGSDDLRGIPGGSDRICGVPSARRCDTGGHILLNATDPALESDLRTAGVTGGIAPEPGRGPVRHHRQQPRRQPARLLRQADGRVRRDAAAGGTGSRDGDRHVRERQSARSADPAMTALLLARAGPEIWQLGETYELATITCGATADSPTSSIDGTALPMTAHTVGGLQTFSGLVRVPPQGASTLTADVRSRRCVARRRMARNVHALAPGTTRHPADGGHREDPRSQRDDDRHGEPRGGPRQVSTWRGPMSEALTLTTLFQRRGTDPRQVVLYLIFPLIFGSSSWSASFGATGVSVAPRCVGRRDRALRS